MLNKAVHIGKLASEITRVHLCGTIHDASVPVHEFSEGKTVWRGNVEVFTLINHPETKRAYAWLLPRGKKQCYVVILELPPVVDAKSAVQASLSTGCSDGQPG